MLKVVTDKHWEIELDPSHQWVCIGPMVWGVGAHPQSAVDNALKRYRGPGPWRFQLYTRPKGAFVDGLGQLVWPRVPGHTVEDCPHCRDIVDHGPEEDVETCLRDELTEAESDVEQAIRGLFRLARVLDLEHSPYWREVLRLADRAGELYTLRRTTHKTQST